MFYDKIGESCSTTGTGTFSLTQSAFGSFRTWRNGPANGTDAFYLATNDTGSIWELGYGTFTQGSPDTLTRTLLASSTGSLINWATTPYRVYSAPVGVALKHMLAGLINGVANVPGWLPAGAKWWDYTLGISTAWIKKTYVSGTRTTATNHAEEGRAYIGLSGGAPNIFTPSPRHYWVDKGANNYTVTADDIGKVLEFDVTSAARVPTLPAISSVGHGFAVGLRGYGSSVNGLTLTPNGTDAIDAGAASATKTIPGELPVVWVEVDGARSKWVTSYAQPSPGFTNRLVNGDFAIDQRNEGASQTFTAAAAVAYTVDRWYASCTGANITGQRVAGTGANKYAYKFTGAASNTAVLFGQRIEAANVADLVSADIVASLQVKSSSITSLTWTAYYANAADDFSAKTQIATGTLTIGSTLASYALTFNAGANAANGIAIEFSCGALLAAQTLQFEAVQFQTGTTPTAFERKSYAARIAECQRYYQKSYDIGTALATSTALGLVGGGQGNGVVNSIVTIPLSPPMRSAPTLSYWDKAGNASKYSTGNNNSFTDNVGALTVQNASTRAFEIYQSSSGTAHIHYAANAEL